MTELFAATPEEIAQDVAAMGERVINQLRTVFDPEIPVNIFDLGLIYKIDVDPRPDEKFDVKIDMTLTTPNCPVAGSLPGSVQQAVAKAEGAGEVTVKLTFDPPWDMSKMTDEARLTLNMM